MPIGNEMIKIPVWVKTGGTKHGFVSAEPMKRLPRITAFLLLTGEMLTESERT